MRQDSMVSGTVALTIAAVLNRVVGFAFRAYLVRLVGQEAIGIYQMSYPLYASVMTVATAGISVGVAKLTAEARQKGDSTALASIIKTGCYLALFTGLTGMVILMLASNFIASTLLGETRAFIPLLALAPALPVVSLAGVLRGYYQGMRYMYLVATGLIVEQLGHVVASVHLALRLRGLGAGPTSVGLALGCTVGEVVGLLTLGLLAFYAARNRPKRVKLNYPPLLRMVLPVATGRIILALTQALNTILMPRALRYMGYSASQAAIAYGQLTGMAINVLFIPAVLTFPLASNLLPIMAETSHGKGPTKKHNFERALTFALLLGVPASVIFVLVGPQICELLFGVADAGQLLAKMGWVAWMIYIQHVTTATLQGLGRPGIPARNAALCAVLSAASIVVLTALCPQLGVLVPVYAVMVSISAGAILGLVAVLKTLGGLRSVLTIILKGAAAGAVAMFITETVLTLFQSPLHMTITALACVTLTFYGTARLLKLRA